MSESKVKLDPRIAVVVWRALNEEDRSEKDLLAACIIGSGFEPDFEDGRECVEFYREYLIAEGLIEADITPTAH